IKLAMINIHRRLAETKHPARMLLQIHDELVFETPKKDAASLITLIRDEMPTAMELNVPLVVDVRIGENWLDAEPV
ncbi:MAG: DNA polymerase, partial [Vicinamibacterales bacterium]